MPPSEALPKELRGLPTHQSVTLRTGNAWDGDLKTIGDRLRALAVFEREGGQRLPETPKKRELPSLTQKQLTAALEDSQLRLWEPWEEVLPSEYPAKRQELRRVFDVQSFAEAVQFMAFLAPRFDQENHHPRWSNEWRRVAIRLSTWAARNQITEEDVRVARKIEQWFCEGKQRQQRVSITSDEDVGAFESPLLAPRGRLTQYAAAEQQTRAAHSNRRPRLRRDPRRPKRNRKA